jgi:enolase-phosphatase E1
MIKAVVTDIEGTTSSLSFVKDLLFPYARAHLPDFVRSRAEQADIKALLESAAETAGIAFSLEAVIDQLLLWIDEDAKVTPLKSLQGLIWEDGYHKGDFNGHLYPDAAENLKKWHGQGFALYVYSSGSVRAQKLLFAHTEYGDMTPLFSGYFDTHIGGKREAASYAAIADSIGFPVSEIMFLSDIKEELDAARAIGFGTVWLNRDSPLDAAAEHPQVASFDAIAF